MAQHTEQFPREEEAAPEIDAAREQAQPPSTDARLADLERKAEATQAGIEHLERSMDATRASLQQIAEKLGISPAADAHSLAIAEERLSALQRQKAALDSERLSLRSSEGPEVGEAALESSAEREAVIEHAQTERAGLLRKVFENRAVGLALNVVPGVDVAKLTFEAVRGKTIDGEELKGRHRVNYALIAGSFAITYSLLLSGHPEYASASGTVAGILAKIEFGPKAITAAAEYVREKSPAAARLLDASARFVEAKKGAAKEIAAQCKEALLDAFSKMGPPGAPPAFSPTRTY